MWNIKTGIKTSNNRGNWNHLRIIQKTFEQLTWASRLKELQKTDILGTAHVPGEVLM
jgi:hypothetical protein